MADADLDVVKIRLFTPTEFSRLEDLSNACYTSLKHMRKVDELIGSRNRDYETMSTLFDAAVHLDTAFERQARLYHEFVHGLPLETLIFAFSVDMQSELSGRTFKIVDSGLQESDEARQLEKQLKVIISYTNTKAQMAETMKRLQEYMEKNMEVGAIAVA